MLRHRFGPDAAAIFAVVLFAVAFTKSPARAADDTSTLAFGLGYYDITDGDDAAADFRLDYRHGEGLYFVKPWAGVEATSDGGLWGGGGIYIDIPVFDRVVLTGSTGVGAYHDGDGKDLGHTVEFRSGAEITYRLDNGMRLGASFSHISNASLGDDNPGVNILNAVFVVPLSTLMPE